ncbi:glycosyltransferase family 2 protein [Deinococcus phoenicis]|uniref:glycosyltransferase family 2 protein n=1 Tax=Deinococcus phoenicis TaxID=1476583 RepID=UPI00054EF1E1|nr:glycosyltransferase family 2 protein [Deinococcus phoenicis]
MAGHGSRFRDAGYSLPKYQIEVHGRTLFEWSLLSLRDFTRIDASFTFVALRAHTVRPFVEAMAGRLGLASVRVVELDEVTDGQATTVLAAAPGLAENAPLLIYNIDTFVDPRAIRAADWQGDGWIVCFPGAGSGWSFARTVSEHDLRVTEVREKQRISPHASVGLYGFSSLALYTRAYHTYYADAARLEKGEKYIAPLYNQLLAWQRPVYVSAVGQGAVYPLGTPEEVQAFALQVPPEVPR